MKRLVVVISLFVLVPALALACGRERWPVKTGTDKDAAKVNESPTPGTINQLRQIHAPINPNIRPDTRYSPVELSTYELTAWIRVIKPEADQDYHVVLTDSQGRTMIVESTHPDCAKGSRFASQIADVRKTLDLAFGGSIQGRQQTRMLVTVTGVGFFDRIHGQEGVAPNGIELHPLLHVIAHEHKTLGALKKAVQAKGEDQ
jgi:hypothetical protein